MSGLKVEVIKTALLENFPSGSSISYFNERLYVAGDDAQTLLILDTDYSHIGEIRLFDFAGKRIPKPVKADLETSCIVHASGVTQLLLMGSGATPAREIAIAIPLNGEDLTSLLFPVIHTGEFIRRVQAKVLEINIEAMALVGERLLLGNRGNDTHPVNQIVITDIALIDSPYTCSLSVVPLQLPGKFYGISEMCYHREHDVLWFTFSTEATGNAYDDGVIGDSFIGWLDQASQAIGLPNIALTGIINLSVADPVFKNEKIEGICFEPSTGTDVIAHLVSDNDRGDTRLFHIRLRRS